MTMTEPRYPLETGALLKFCPGTPRELIPAVERELARRLTEIRERHAYAPSFGVKTRVNWQVDDGVEVIAWLDMALESQEAVEAVAKESNALLAAPLPDAIRRYQVFDEVTA